MDWLQFSMDFKGRELASSGNLPVNKRSGSCEHMIKMLLSSIVVEEHLKRGKVVFWVVKEGNPSTFIVETETILIIGGMIKFENIQEDRINRAQVSWRAVRLGGITEKKEQGIEEIC